MKSKTIMKKKLQPLTLDAIEMLLDRKMDEKLQPIKDDLLSVKEDVLSVKTDLSSVKTDLSSVKTDLSSVKNDLSSVKTDVASVKTDVSSVRSDLVAMEKRLDTKFLKLFDFLDKEVMKDRRRTARLEEVVGISNNEY